MTPKGGQRCTPTNPANLSTRLSSRRSHLVLVALIVARPRRRRARSPCPARRSTGRVKQGPRPAGRARGRAEGAAAEGAQADVRRPRPLGHDHAEPRRQARRLRADIRKQGTNQIVIQLAGVHDPAQAAANLIGKTAQLELYDLEPALVPPSVVRDRQPVATTSLYELLSRVQASAKKGDAEPVRTSSSRSRSTTTTGTGKNKKTTTTTVCVQARRRPDARRCTATRRPATPACSTAYRRQDPEGRQGAAGAGEDGRDHAATRQTPVVCPGDPNGAAAGRQDRLLPLQARPVPERPLRRTASTRT